MAEIEITEDVLLDGRLRLRQPRTGYRAGADALLLAAASEPPAGGRIYEPGCGVGAAILALAQRRTDLTLLGIEIDAETARLARENVALNGLQERVEIRCGDALAEAVNGFDAIILNPPYAAPERGRPPADPRRRLAFVDQNGLDRWVPVLADRLTGGGVLTLVHRADALPEALAALDGRLGSVEVAPIFPRAGESAHRMLLRARKGGRAPMRMWRGLVLHQAGGGAFTEEAEEIFRGRGCFAWR